MKIQFRADNNNENIWHPKPVLTIIFETDNTSTVEQLNDIYTTFLKAIGYSVLEEADTIDDPFEELEEEEAGYASDELEF